ncbi:MAG: glycosyltransferase [Comamonadaceae bacterium]|nr:MAG: glycosyltransferase [Comamonadaceae bacterium]
MAVLLLAAACSNEADKAGAAMPSASPASSAKPGFVNKVWEVSLSTGVAPGMLYVFLSDGTLVMTSPNSKPAFGAWTYRDGAFTMIEESQEYKTDILALSTIVLHASTKPEPFGRTFLEGMALGKAVIASNEGGPLDVIEDGVDGLLIPPRDPQRLADAVLRLLDQPALVAALGNRAARKARDYSIERHTEAVCAVLHRVMRGD